MYNLLNLWYIFSYQSIYSYSTKYLLLKYLSFFNSLWSCLDWVYLINQVILLAIYSTICIISIHLSLPLSNFYLSVNYQISIYLFHYQIYNLFNSIISLFSHNCLQSCQECGYESVNMKRLTQHLYSSHTLFYCQLCEVSFTELR